ncbi:MAG: 4Fe-4S dicluster domain-containing protein [Dysgonamonadaceae bacterium]|jgi:formate hydrogenlyase subunit 6/NADH:ubiquinone oxidoreductase subunit I|nr:4Fe-4S dicluster domain-containing protein [Dysgonamonadaceae bacterium]
MEKSHKILRKESYHKLIHKLLESKQIYAPVQEGGRINYRRIASSKQLTDDYILPENSVKSFVFPAIEKLFSYTKNKDDVTIENLDPEAIPAKVVLGVRPCDSLGIKQLSAIFNWSPEDPIFQKRMEKTTIIGLACTRADAYCFCTSLGSNPGDARGSDLFLTPKNTEDYIVEIVTAKGEAIVALAPELFEGVSESACTKSLAEVPKYFDDAHLEEKMKAAFDTLVFDEYAMRCIGCSACAFVCPVCGCFDIQDETKGARGQRMRCWDSCGAKLFTLHTSGHTPRSTQGARWRQRLMHKFSYMPERLEVRGCVGCGRCSRRCPVDMNMSEQLTIISK